MNIPVTNTNELIQIDLLKQSNTNLCADIDCLHLRESILKYSSKTYRMLFNANPEPIALIRLSDGHPLEANQRFEKLFACTKDEFRAAGIEFFLIENTKKLHNMAREALRNGRWFQTECNLQSHNKDLLPVAITASLIKHDGETLVQASMRKL